MSWEHIAATPLKVQDFVFQPRKTPRQRPRDGVPVIQRPFVVHWETVWSGSVTVHVETFTVELPSVRRDERPSWKKRTCHCGKGLKKK